MDFQLRNKVPKRRVKAKRRADRTEPTHSNHLWAMEQSPTLVNGFPLGRGIRCLYLEQLDQRSRKITDLEKVLRGEAQRGAETRRLQTMPTLGSNVKDGGSEKSADY